jgi:DNA replication and repair protein RecF
MAVARLTLTDFRSYNCGAIAPGPGVNILTGDNGAGKTNILEAISLLAPGRGLRGAALGEMARSGGPGGFAVVADISGSTIGVGTLAAAPDRRIVRIDGAPVSAASLAERAAMVWVTPSMDRLFTDSAGERRRFLDRLVVALEPNHARNSARYEAAMRQRNRLLSEETGADPDWLSALEAQLGDYGAAITRSRVAAITEIMRAQSVLVDPDFPRAGLALTNIMIDGLTQQLRANRALDAAAGRTLHGPHTHDLDVSHVGKQQPARRCSTGEQKALLLGIVLAHADLVAQQRGFRPILLLDEVAAHLDATRRAALLSRIAANGGQAWLTGTDAMLFADAPEDSRHFQVAPGDIQSA